MNLPNSLTVLRVALIPLFVVLLLINIPNGDYWAALVFGLAALTDTLDGYLARRWKQVTKLGIVMDPIADKLLITAALISLVELARVPAWIAIVILGREFAVTGLRAFKAEEGIVIPASFLGKMKTLTQVVAVFFSILAPAYRPYISFPLDYWVLLLTVCITVISGVEYFVKFLSLTEEFYRPHRK
ncbi:MAG TPA: CDP-diacylglycerol--glycerol-3-phosphate 3-phosphatidyltransferase [Syntrophomonadaceae bacterium]|nr:CDP-diacylglycerol--glycerol-3-phosphate 3-phosphatidyltransferase [Syntrophomonadaceae bacterium]